MNANRKLDVMIAEALGWKRVCLSQKDTYWWCRPQSLSMITQTFSLKKTKGGKGDPDCRWLTTKDWALKVPNYSSNITSAWLVVEAMTALGHPLDIIEDLTTSDINPVWGASFGKYSNAKTAPAAICLAALLTLKPRLDLDELDFIDDLVT
jgi:hypothetical protein